MSPSTADLTSNSRRKVLGKPESAWAFSGFIRVEIYLDRNEIGGPAVNCVGRGMRWSRDVWVGAGHV